MREISLLLWDVGGVLLSNGWDTEGRAEAARRFGLDPVELERRHHSVLDEFETGRLDWNGYLDGVVFYEPRKFSAEHFGQFVRDRSTAIGPSLEVARRLREGGKYVMAALNNESRELNEYRIAAFGLNQIFHAFFSSCYTGRRKPSPEAYRFALVIAQREPEETLFLDDRPENVEAAAALGLHTALVRDPRHLQEQLTLAGIDPN